MSKIVDFMIWAICMVATTFLAVQTARVALDHGAMWSLTIIFVVLTIACAEEAIMVWKEDGNEK